MTKAEFLQEKGRLTVFLSGEIDHHGAAKIRYDIDSRILKAMPKVVVMDFTAVTFMDSSGIAVVINSIRKMSRINGELMLSGLNEQPKKVFFAAGIEQLVKIKEVKNEV